MSASGIRNVKEFVSCELTDLTVLHTNVQLHPTDHFTILELKDQEIGNVRAVRASDIQAL